VAPPSPLEEYIALAIRGAQPREIEDGVWVVELDGFPGVWADGPSPQECLTTLAEVLQDWLMIKLAHRDDDVPVVGGLDLAALLRR
jgi:predicted RNase H-like HicB family nuclease